MAFVKLFSSITESSLWSESKDTRLLFVTMLAKADQNGFVEASVPGLARVANLTLDETVSALACLEGPDPHSKNPDNEGRRLVKMPGGWGILNYGHYRERRNNEERQAYMREYMADYRKQSVNKCKQSLIKVSHGKPPLAQERREKREERGGEVEAEKDTPSPPPDGSDQTQPTDGGRKPAQILKDRLQGLGMPSDAKAMEEWRKLTAGRAGCTTADDALAFIGWAVERGLNDGVNVKYSKHAALYADEWARRA